MKLKTAKDFVVKHKVAIAVVATTAICLKINRIALAQHIEFLKEKNLLDEFYSGE